MGGDEEQFGRLVNRSLSRIAYTNILAADPAEASRCLNEQTLHVILSDVRVPGQSDIDLTRHIRIQK